MSGFEVPRGRGPAPLVARIAAALLLAAAALTVVWLIVFAASFSSYPGGIPDIQNAGVMAWGGYAAIVIMSLVLAGGLVLCPLAMNRGNAAGWYGAFGPIVVLVFVVIWSRGGPDGGVAVAILSVSAEAAGLNGTDYVLSFQPDWFGDFWMLIDYLTGLVVVASAVLLMLPPSIDHFTKRPAVTSGGYGVPWG